MTVVVLAEVEVFFLFLDGSQGIKTVRKEADSRTTDSKISREMAQRMLSSFEQFPP
jgi:hypothetical protein